MKSQDFSKMVGQAATIGNKTFIITDVVSYTAEPHKMTVQVIMQGYEHITFCDEFVDPSTLGDDVIDAEFTKEVAGAMLSREAAKHNDDDPLIPAEDDEEDVYDAVARYRKDHPELGPW